MNLLKLITFTKKNKQTHNNLLTSVHVWNTVFRACADCIHTMVLN